MDSSKSCWFVTVKYVLISILLVDFVNLMVALSSGISETDKSKQQETKEPVTTKKILETVRLVTTLISVIFGLVGVSRESFCLSITTGIIMVFETVASFFGNFDASTIVSMVINALIALTTFAFAYMCKAGMNVFHTAQIEPIMVARNRAASKCPAVLVNVSDEKPVTPEPLATGTTSEGSILAPSMVDETKEVSQRSGAMEAVIPEKQPPVVIIQDSLSVARPDEPVTTQLTYEGPNESKTVLTSTEEVNGPFIVEEGSNYPPTQHSGD